jgi:hypothetical protein
MSGKRRSLITPGDVDQVFNDAVIKELAKGSPRNADPTRFAQSVRNDAQLFIEAKARLNNPQLRKEIARLYGLNNRAQRGDRAAQELAREMDTMHAHVRCWLVRCNPEGRSIPTSKEIISLQTRTNAIHRLRLILSYGSLGSDAQKEGRKRPSGKRSRPFTPPLLRAPGVERKPDEQSNCNEGRPRGGAEREFVRNLRLTYWDAASKKPPDKVDFQSRGPFSEFVHRCFELVGAPQGYVTKLINELGQARHEAAGGETEYPEDFGAYLDERERFYRERWEAEAQEAEAQIDPRPIRDGKK